MLDLAHCAARRKHQRGPEEFDDLLQESRVGLIRGFDRCDAQRGLKPSSHLLSRATGLILHCRRGRCQTVRITWRLRDLYATGMKIQCEREQNGQPALCDHYIAAALSVRLERWAAAVQSHRRSQILGLNAFPGEQTSCSEDDEH